MRSEYDSDERRKGVEVWDHLLSKYVAVWLWSIVFGASTGLGAGFIFLSYRQLNYGPLFPTVLGLGIFGVVFAIGAWFYLYLFLVREIIPQVCGKIDRPDWRSMRYLARAFFCTFSATLVGLALLLTNFVFGALS